MSDIESATEIDRQEVEFVDPIEPIFQGECASLSGRSQLTFSVGRHSENGTLHLAIVGNSGGGMWCKDWASASAIQDLVLGEVELTAKSFHSLHPGKSINTGGFVLAALKELGLIRANVENTRMHEHVPGTTYEKVVSTCMAHVKAEKADAGGRKTLRVKPKEG